MQDGTDIKAQKSAAPPARFDWQLIAFWILAAMVAGAAGVAIGAPSAVGTLGSILLISLAAGGLVLLLWLMQGPGRKLGVFPTREQGEIAPTAANLGPGEQALLDALPEPSLITDRKGAPVAANAAYRMIASASGQLGESARPPTVDRLFGANAGLAAPMFRLARAARERKNVQESLPATQMRPGAPLIQFDASVCPIASGHTLWRLFEHSAAAEAPAANGRELADEAPVGFFAAKADGQIVYLNQSLRDLLGIADGARLTAKDIFPRDHQRVLRRDKKPDQGPVRVETLVKTAAGKDVPVVILTTWPADDKEDGLSRSIVLAESVVAAIAPPLAPAVDSRSGRVADPMFDNAPFGAAHLDGRDAAAALIEDSNGAFMAMTDGAALPGVAFADLFTSDDGRADVLERLSNSHGHAIELKLKSTTEKPDQERSVHVYLSPGLDGRAVAYIIDLTEFKQLELRLAQSEKLQAIGQLAGGVAHDFNNLLTAITLNCDKLMSRHPAGDPSFNHLSAISQTATRAAELVRMLLAYSRKQTFKREVLEVDAVLSDMKVLLDQVLDERVSLEITHGRDLPTIRADKSQIETVLMNLAVNARDAMVAKGGGGKLTVRTARVTEAHAQGHGYHHVGPGDYVLIEVSDTGAGIAPEHLEKIFEPFFTTKDAGKGTGLGLATVYGIVKQSGGFIYPSSKLGRGTTFRIYLPGYTRTAEEETEAEAEARAAAAAPARPADMSGVGRILLVEDEDHVRSIAASSLQSLGYQVTEAADGEEALEYLEANPGSIDLMISDVVLPGIDGPGVLAQGKAYLGDAKVIFISGYAERDFARTLDEEREVLFLPKPFTLKQLAEMVKKALAGKQSLAA